jgi:multimeric flavodoxin WrbA
MKVIAINGSPREKWNTATLLEKALDGVASKGAGNALWNAECGLRNVEHERTVIEN